MSINKALKPGVLTINGVDYPAIYTFGALAIMEDELGDHFTEVPARITGKLRRNEAGEIELDQSNRLSARETAIVLSAMIRAAGGSMQPQEVLNSLPVSQIDSVTMQAMDIMMEQMPEPGEGSEKNADT